MKTIFPQAILSGLALNALFLTVVLGAGPQNPFGPQGNTGGGNTNGATSSIPNDQIMGAGSSGSQNPFGGGGGTAQGSGTQNPFGGNNNASTGYQPLKDGDGCPATRAGPPTANLVPASSAICPSGDGKTYQTADGAFFYIQCCTHGSSTALKTLIARDFRDCMNECAKTDTCNSIQFVAHHYDSTPQNECVLSANGGYSTGKCGDDSHSYAFLIDPPPIDSPNFANVLCSTECPYANGQQHVTSVGEAFRMDCGMRHGTKPIYKDRKNSLKECVEACGKLAPCRNVDWDQHRKICYYSDHQGPPTIPAPGFHSAYSMGCAGACGGEGCGGYSKPTQPDSPAGEEDTSPFPQDGYLPTPAPPEPLCPGLNGKIKTVNGKNYKMYCGVATGCDSSLDIRPAPYPIKSLDECLDDCSKNGQCQSMNFLETDLATGKSGQCNIRRCAPQPSLTGNHIAALPV